jgi:hypothetical protein
MVKEIAGYIVAPMWHEFMGEALATMPKEVFNEPPATPESVSPALRGVSNVNGQFHSLLYWVSKDNPQGVGSLFPASDPQFPYWEYPIQAWLAGGQQTLFAASTASTTASTTPGIGIDGSNIGGQ